jgi:hypothetical protein
MGYIGKPFVCKYKTRIQVMEEECDFLGLGCGITTGPGIIAVFTKKSSVE